MRAMGRTSGKAPLAAAKKWSGLAPILGDAPRVLVLGSAPSVLSDARRQYYGNPQNHFWRIVSAYTGLWPADAPNTAVTRQPAGASAVRMAGKKQCQPAATRAVRRAGPETDAMPRGDYTARVDALRAAGVAVWDALASCARKGSSDATITDAVPNDVAGLLRRHPSIRVVACNGATSATYTRQHLAAARSTQGAEDPPAARPRAVKRPRAPSSSHDADAALGGSAKVFTTAQLPGLPAGVVLVELPSTSPANAATGIDVKCRAWDAAFARAGVAKRSERGVAPLR